MAIGHARTLYANLARGKELRRLVSIVGEGALSEDDRRYLGFADDFERSFVGQGEDGRSIIETLDLAWNLLARFPAEGLKRIKPELRERYHEHEPERE